MAIESIAAAAVAKEAVAAKAAEMAQQQLGQKMAMESVENHQLLQTMEQTNLANKFRIGELSAPEVDKKDVFKGKEQEAIDDLSSKLETPTSNIEDSLQFETDKCISSYEDRLGQTPVEGERTHWDGERGESTCYPEENYVPVNQAMPSGQEMKNLCNKYEQSGVSYKDAIPDFSPFSHADVQIPNMSEQRYGPNGNFEQADTVLAKEYNEIAKDGKTDWTPRDIQDMREKNDLTWHECNDRKTCQLVPRDINSYFGHLGGVSECKKMNFHQGDIFDA